MPALLKAVDLLDVGVLGKHLGAGGPPLHGLSLFGYAAGLTVNALVAVGGEAGWRAYLTPVLAGRIGVASTSVENNVSVRRE